MAIDISVPDSPGWWLNRCVTQLKARRKRLDALAKWLEGDPPLPEGALNSKQAYEAFQRFARTNWAELIVEAVRDRMHPVGFRTAASEDDLGDAEAWRIWVDNSLPVEVTDVFTWMLGLGDAYMIVGGEDVDGRVVPVVTAEDPRQVVTIHDPVRPSRVRAAAKVFHDPDMARSYAYLYLPGRRYVAVSASAKPSVFSPHTWDWDASMGGAEGEELPHDRVPVVRFQNRGGVAEFERHIDHMMRINHQTLQRMQIATMQAFRQRAIKGELPTHDEQGNEIDYDMLLSASPGALWQLPASVDLWESDQVDLQGVLSAAKDDVRDLAAATRTPVHYLMPDAVSQSAEGASTMKEGGILKAEDRVARATEPLREAMSLAFLVAGDRARAERSRIEVLWAPTDRVSVAERYMAASQAIAAGVPWRTVMRDVLGFTPTQVAEMEIERAADSRQGDAGRELSAAEVAQKVYLAAREGVLSREEARDLIKRAGAELADVSA